MLINNLIKIFVKNHQDVNDPEVRGGYGVFVSILSIFLNLILVIFKLIIGVFTNSIAIIADGINNLTDVASNFATLVGFRLSLRSPDADHPYGHGRYEYISGIIISFFILMVALLTIRDSIEKIILNEPINFDIVAVIVLIGAIVVKLYMAYFNNYVGKKIDSTSLMAASQDSLNDVLSTGATLVALFLSQLTTLPVDGIIGFMVGVIVLKSGVEIFKDTVNPLLGLAPSRELVKEIAHFVTSHDVAKGCHDIMIHDYGPSRKFMTLHVEVDANSDIMETHDAIDNLEEELLDKFKIMSVIHMDPIDYDNPDLEPIRRNVMALIKVYNREFSIHDFRMVYGPTHINLVFDLVVPFSHQKSWEEIRRELTEIIENSDNRYRVKMNLEHNYY